LAEQRWTHPPYRITASSALRTGRAAQGVAQGVGAFHGRCGTLAEGREKVTTLKSCKKKAQTKFFPELARNRVK
jgi:hypothetical protein